MIFEEDDTSGFGIEPEELESLLRENTKALNILGMEMKNVMKNSPLNDSLEASLKSLDGKLAYNGKEYAKLEHMLKAISFMDSKFTGNGSNLEVVALQRAIGSVIPLLHQRAISGNTSAQRDSAYRDLKQHIDELEDAINSFGDETSDVTKLMHKYYQNFAIQAIRDIDARKIASEKQKMYYGGTLPQVQNRYVKTLSDYEKGKLLAQESGNTQLAEAYSVLSTELKKTFEDLTTKVMTLKSKGERLGANPYVDLGINYDKVLERRASIEKSVRGSVTSTNEVIEKTRNEFNRLTARVQESRNKINKITRDGNNTRLATERSFHNSRIADAVTQNRRLRELEEERLLNQRKVEMAVNSSLQRMGLGFLPKVLELKRLFDFVFSRFNETTHKVNRVTVTGASNGFRSLQELRHTTRPLSSGVSGSKVNLNRAKVVDLAINPLNQSLVSRFTREMPDSVKQFMGVPSPSTALMIRPQDIPRMQMEAYNRNLMGDVRGKARERRRQERIAKNIARNQSRQFVPIQSFTPRIPDRKLFKYRVATDTEMNLMGQNLWRKVLGNRTATLPSGPVFNPQYKSFQVGPTPQLRFKEGITKEVKLNSAPYESTGYQMSKLEKIFYKFNDVLMATPSKLKAFGSKAKAMFGDLTSSMTSKLQRANVGVNNTIDNISQKLVSMFPEHERLINGVSNYLKTHMGKLSTGGAILGATLTLVGNGFTRTSDLFLQGFQKMSSMAQQLWGQLERVGNFYDRFANADSQLRYVNAKYGQGKLSNAQLKTMIANTASSSRMGYAEMASNVARFAHSGGFNGNLDVAVRNMGIASKSMQLSGATQQTIDSVLLQMSQAYSKARLDGDERRSVFEAFPEFANALVDVTGKQKKDLLNSKAFSITTEHMNKAFEKLGTQVDRAFAQMPVTWSSLKAEFQNRMGEVLTNTGSGRKVMDSIFGSVRKLLDYLKSTNGQKLLDSFATSIENIVNIVVKNIEKYDWAIKLMADNLDTFVAFKVFGEKLKIFGKTIIGVSTALGVGNGIYKLLKFFGVIGKLGAIGGKVFGAVKGVASLGGVIATLSNPITLAIGAFAGLSAIIYKFVGDANRAKTADLYDGYTKKELKALGVSNKSAKKIQELYEYRNATYNAIETYENGGKSNYSVNLKKYGIKTIKTETDYRNTVQKLVQYEDQINTMLGAEGLSHVESLLGSIATNTEDTAKALEESQKAKEIEIALTTARSIKSLSSQTVAPTFNITQLPGESGEALAQRIADILLVQVQASPA